jgi:hypothetical protein
MAVLVLPHLLDINGITSKLISLPIIPLFFIKTPLETSTFNPAIVYALWYVNNCTSLVAGFASLQAERIVGPLLGSVMAAMVCNEYFPVDSNSYSRRKQS